METIATGCCIVGGGPAGMMLGFLLARAGVEVVVLEKHADFLRDFRGDTIHPSTLDVMAELGLLDRFLARPHDELEEIAGQIGATKVVMADFRHVPTRCKFLAFMPQWDFLDFIADEAKAYPRFRLIMQAEVTGLVEEDGRVAGVVARTREGEVTVRAPLTVGADGRHSIVRDRAGLKVLDLGAPMDVLWMRISKKADDPEQMLGRIDAGRMFVMLDRGDYWQCAYVIPKGSLENLRSQGLDALRADIARLVPWLAGRVGELATWDDIKLLTVVVDRLERWSKPGLLCIGDAAHAMSPVGGVGINLAIQDAVAASNILARPLRDGTLRLGDLEAVQKRREWPTKATQWMQLQVQNRVISRVLALKGQIGIAWPVSLLRSVPYLRRFPARLIGVGVRPEHVLTQPASP
jgi:2-polyprenyl-6-methoxyphenol hydroxylase-like FAD-dependent oxidoreductase